MCVFQRIPATHKIIITATEAQLQNRLYIIGRQMYYPDHFCFFSCITGKLCEREGCIKIYSYVFQRKHSSYINMTCVYISHHITIMPVYYVFNQLILFVIMYRVGIIIKWFYLISINRRTSYIPIISTLSYMNENVPFNSIKQEAILFYEYIIINAQTCGQLLG